MRLSYGWSSIQVRCWASRTEMEHHLACFGTKLIIGESVAVEREFFSVTIEPEISAAKTRRIALGVCSEGHGITPQILPLLDRGILLVGANSDIVAVSTDSGEIAFRVELGFLFRSVVLLSDTGLFLVFHDIGVTALYDDGRTAWRLERDVLEDVRIENGTLYMTFMDSEPAAVELTSGRELR